MAKNFCTCGDISCPLHPTNHDMGCDPCMSKNLKKGEIPTCLFKMVDEDISDVKKFDAAGFVKHYKASLKNKKIG